MIITAVMFEGRSQAEVARDYQVRHDCVAPRTPPPDQGVPVKVISERLGHASPAYTMKQYVHALPGMQAEAASQTAALVLGDTMPSRPHSPVLIGG